MYELKKIGKVFTSKFVGPGPSSYKKNYRAAVSHRLRNTGIECTRTCGSCLKDPQRVGKLDLQICNCNNIPTLKLFENL